MPLVQVSQNNTGTGSLYIKVLLFRPMSKIKLATAPIGCGKVVAKVNVYRKYMIEY